MTSESAVTGAAQADGHDPPVDLDWLNECMDNDAEAIKTIVDLYVTRTDGQILELETAMSANAAADVKRIAHSCVGSSGTCGMERMASLFKSLEKLGAARNLMGGPAVVNEVRQEFERVKQFLSSKGMR